MSANTGGKRWRRVPIAILIYFAVVSAVGYYVYGTSSGAGFTIGEGIGTLLLAALIVGVWSAGSRRPIPWGVGLAIAASVFGAIMAPRIHGAIDVHHFKASMKNVPAEQLPDAITGSTDTQMGSLLGAAFKLGEERRGRSSGPTYEFRHARGLPTRRA